MSSTLIWVHILVAFSVVLPAVLMQFVNLDKPNNMLGYRTPTSLKSAETWRFANKCSANIMLWGTGITLTIQLVTALTMNQETAILITCGFLTFMLIGCLLYVEIELAKRFDKEGKPKPGYGKFD